jgi:Rad3-related DNA helicase
MVSPRLLGLPHDNWRSGQLDAYNNSNKMIENGGGTIVIEAPTGTGKSGIPTALGANHNVIVLVHNLGLLKQYQDTYGFDIIMGKQEYDCVHKQKLAHWKDVYGLVPKASDCHFKNMYECPFSSACPYVIAREKAMSSKRAACTYKYAALSEWVQKREGIIAMDEAHDCYEELIEFAKFTIDDNTVKDFKFPKMPLVNFGEGGKGDILDGQNRLILKDWVMDCMKKISIIDLFSGMTQEGSKNQRMFERLTSAMKMIDSDQTLFYKCFIPKYDDDDDAWIRPCLNMELRSLDVKDLIQTITSEKSLTLMMSATIGNPRPLMGELGISDYSFHTYSHPVPINKRPIYDLGFAKMTKANLDAKPALYRLQADAIGKFISSLDPSWRGIVLTTSNYKIGLMRNFLKQSLNGRVMMPKQGSKLNEQISMFTSNKDPGKIFVGTIQGWGSGLSLDYDTARISVIAGVPFSNPGDRFSQLRMMTATGKQYATIDLACKTTGTFYLFFEFEEGEKGCGVGMLTVE